MRVDWCVSSWFRIKNTQLSTQRKMSSDKIDRDPCLHVSRAREQGSRPQMKCEC